ncbi:hypothetical protein [Leptolyngbya sp. FACHB-17]|uniref:hypothetical protein n=1 Tax=unclassified Leptolyngbya TaxID=2650499 RepID=UPI001680DA46|nr:hypothetical protein [Leptolyngbya sp. FACHB-17]MBD2078368.1 hypothetical protein [Leptolyngbya sp. FACHB-17]
MFQKGNGNKKVKIGKGNYIEGDSAGRDINKNKNFRFSLSFLAVAALAVGGVSTIAVKTNWFQFNIQNQSNQTGKTTVAPSPETTSSGAAISNTLSTPTPTPATYQPDPPYSGLNDVQFPCGKSTDISGIEVIADCPTEDANKDDKPDRSYALLYFTNKAKYSRSLTFKGAPYPVTGNPDFKILIQSLGLSKIKVPIYRFGGWYSFSGDFTGTSTVTLRPGQSFAALRYNLDSFISGFTLSVGAGKPLLKIKESTIISLPYGQVRYDAPSKSAYGLFATMACLDTCLIELSNESSSRRAFLIRAMQSELQWTFIAESSGRGGMGNLPLLNLRQPYEVTYVIPE